MKKTVITLFSLTALMTFSHPVQARWGNGPIGIINGPVDGLVTGALIGSVFGPDQEHRIENATIGGAVGLLLGSRTTHRHPVCCIVPHRRVPPYRVRHVIHHHYYEY
ncbi:MAG: hypothetical protein H7832_01060 [Magnetococcus sp. DMHC-6]